MRYSVSDDALYCRQCVTFGQLGAKEKVINYI